MEGRYENPAAAIEFLLEQGARAKGSCIEYNGPTSLRVWGALDYLRRTYVLVWGKDSITLTPRKIISGEREAA